MCMRDFALMHQLTCVQEGYMTNLSRRNVLIGLSGTMWIGTRLRAASLSSTRMRHDVDSSQGKVMLEKYARAVTAMMSAQLPQSDTRSWLYQWYIHAVPSVINGQPVSKA